MFKIYILSYCRFSLNAVELLKKYNLEHEIIGADNNRKQIDTLVENYKTYPKIFYVYENQNIFLGGNDNLEHMLNTYHTIIKNKDLNVIKNTKYLEKKHIYHIMIYILKKN
jgi:glutaredoxin-related protein